MPCQKIPCNGTRHTSGGRSDSFVQGDLRVIYAAGNLPAKAKPRAVIGHGATPAWSDAHKIFIDKTLIVYDFYHAATRLSIGWSVTGHPELIFWEIELNFRIATTLQQFK